MYTFKIVNPVNLPNCVLISQMFLNFRHFFLVFWNFFSLIRLDFAVLWVFQKIRTSSYNLCKKSYIWLNIWAKWGKKFVMNDIWYAVRDNAITSEVIQNTLMK